MASPPESDVRVVYEFGGFRADPVTRRLSNGHANLPLTPKAFDTLLVLIANRGEVVSKLDLMDAIWAETAVEENNLTQQIATLRRALGERAGEHRFIVTLPGKGYSFVSPVHEVTIGADEELVIMQATRSTVTIDIADTGLSAWRDFVGRSSVRGYTLAAVYSFIVCVLAFWPTAFGGPDTQTIAVLTFRTSAVEDEALGAGIRDTLQARLGSLEDVAVRPARNGVRTDDALIAGREMDAEVVLTGSIQRDHDRVRVAVEIVDVLGKRIVWGRTFDYKRSEFFELQDAIASEAVRVIQTSRL